MRALSRLASFFRTLFARTHVEKELDDELRWYVESVTARKVAAGMEPEAARRQAVLETGGLASLKEEVRDVRVGAALETTLQDVRHAWRGLVKAPGFAAVTVLILALGIGANTAIFSVVNALLLEPLPYRDSSRLVFVWSDMTEAGYPRAPLSGPELLDLRRRTSRFDGFGAIWSTTVALTGDGEPEQLRVGRVSADFFSVLGRGAALGRTFLPEDEADKAPPRILLSFAVWQRRYARDPKLVGRTVLVNNRPCEVVGVMPKGFTLLLPPDSSVPDDLQAWVPFSVGELNDGRGQQYLRVIGRLKNGVSLEEGRREIDGVAARISKEFTEYGSAGRRFTTVGLKEDDVHEIRPVVLALFWGVAILLLIACVNVASLLVARAASRRREIALRLAIGAGRGRLLRQCAVEGFLLSALGAAAGVLVAYGGLKALLSFRPDGLERLGAARIDGTVLAFTMGTGLVWGVLLSLAPLGEVFKTELVSALQGAGKEAGRGLSQRTRMVLVVVQMALGVVLLVGAGLVARTFVKLQHVDPGFRADGVLSFRLALPFSRYPNPPARDAFTWRLHDELAALPGVSGVGAVSHLPYDHLPNWGGAYLTKPGADESTAVLADYRAVTPDFFRTIDAHLVDGRGFTEADDGKAAPVVVVDERLARVAWPGETALGKRLGLDPFSEGHLTSWATVVGVVRHLRHRSLTQEVREQVYFPQKQIQRNPMAWVVRMSGDPMELAASVRRVVTRLDPQLPIYEPRPLLDYVSEASAPQRFTMVLAATFSAVALLLAGAGLYGVISYAVARRRREFGIRLAIGAQPRDVETLVVSEGLRVAVVGLVLGIPAAASVARLLQSQLFGITARDVPSYLAAVVVLSVAALFASWLGARRATAASPLEVLRAE
jgi:predicted permease